MDDNKKSIFEINIKADKAIEAMSQIEEELEKLKKEQKEIEKGSYKTKAQLQATNEQYSENAAKIKVLNQEMSGYRKQLVNQIKEQRENEGSLKSMRATLSNLRKEYDELGAADRTATGGRGEQLLKEINEVNDALTKAEESSGRFQRNVGNYYGAIMAAGKDLLNGNGPTRPIGPMAGGDNLRQQLRQLRELQQRMEEAGLTGTKEFKDISKAVGDVKDKIADLEAETAHYASDTAKLDEVKGAFGAAQTATQGAADAMQLFGASSETAMAASSKLASATGVVNAGIGIQNALQRQSVLMLGIKRLQELAEVKAQTLLAAANGKATIAQRIFNSVAKANPYLLLFTAIVSVVGAIAAFTFGTDKAAIAQERLNKEMKAFDDLEQVRNKRANDTQNQRDIDAANGKTQTNVQKIAQDYYNAVRNENDAEAALRKLRNDYLMNKDKLDDDAAKQMENDIKEREKTLENLMQTRSDIADRWRVAEALDAKEERDRAKDRAKDAKAARDKELQEVRKAQDAEIANIKNSFEKQRQETTLNYNRQIEDIKKRLKEETGLTATARAAMNKQIVEIEEQKKKALDEIADKEWEDTLKKEAELAKLRLEAAKEEDDRYLEYKLDALRKQAEAEIANAEYTGTQKKLIREKYEKEEAQLIAEYNDRKIEKQETQTAAANSLQLQQLRNNGAKESDVLKEEADQMWATFAEMQKKSTETETEFQNRVATAYGDAIAKQKEADEKKKEEDEQNTQLRAAQVKQYQDLANSISGVTNAMTEGTGAEKAAKKVSAGLAIVSSGLALAEGIEQAAKQKWPANIAAIASVLGSMVPIITNVKTLAGYASGGYVSGAGSGTSDSINARLSNGEYVVKASSVNSSTLPFLNAINGQATGANVGNNNFIAAQMAAALRSMPAPVVSVQDINDGQNRVSVIEKSAKMF